MSIENQLLNSLSGIKDYLDSIGVEALIQQEDNLAPFLLFSAGQDKKNRDLIIQAIFLKDLLRIQEQVEVDEEASDILQFYLSLPFQVPESSVPRVCHFIMLINQLLPIGGFCYLPPEQAIHFQYRLLLENQQTKRLVIGSIIDLIRFYVNHFGPTIEELATTDQSVQDALKQAELFMISVQTP